MSPRLASLALAALLSLRAAQASAAAPDLLGASPRSAALAQADATSDEAASAAMIDPTAAAGDRLSVAASYSLGAPLFRLRGRDAGLPWVRGTTLGLQRGARLTFGPSIGVALGAYLPDQGLARVAFRPASEPVFPRHEAATPKTTFDLVLAVGDRVRAAVGASVGAATEGRGAEVTLAQDARGVHSEGNVDLAVAYRYAPILALSFRPYPDLSMSARLRGARSFGANLDATTAVTLRDNPLTGTTKVKLRGDAAYDPLQVDIGFSTLVKSQGGYLARLFMAFRYERWSAAPPPVASASFEFDLVLRPFERPAQVFSPSLSDTLSPRLAAEISGPSRAASLRVGYAFMPSPAPIPRGYLTLINPAYHQVGLGSGVSLQKLFNTNLPLSLDFALGLQVAPERSFRKEDLSLPWATYTAGGLLPHGSVGLSAEVD